MESYDDVDLTEFSLVCETCDAGQGVASEAEALLAGWSEIEYRPDLPMANYSGVCPDCREKYNYWPTTQNLID